jgi:hypothetical protein
MNATNIIIYDKWFSKKFYFLAKIRVLQLPPANSSPHPLARALLLPHHWQSLLTASPCTLHKPHVPLTTSLSCSLQPSPSYCAVHPAPPPACPLLCSQSEPRSTGHKVQERPTASSFSCSLTASHRKFVLLLDEPSVLASGPSELHDQSPER